jgi:hypothetical protein
MIENVLVFICSLLTVFLLTVSPGLAQQPTKIPRIGYLIATSPSVISVRIDAFRQGLRELGYVEGKSIVIDYRWAERKLDRLPAHAAELVRLNVDVMSRQARQIRGLRGSDQHDSDCHVMG